MRLRPAANAIPALLFGSKLTPNCDGLGMLVLFERKSPLLNEIADQARNDNAFLALHLCGLIYLLSRNNDKN